MEKIHTSEELMDTFSNLNRENSICQVFIPGKGKFTIVLQEEDVNQRTIADDVKANPKLKEMIQKSMSAYQEGRFMSTAELIKSLSPRDFDK